MRATLNPAFLVWPHRLCLAGFGYTVQLIQACAGGLLNPVRRKWVKRGERMKTDRLEAFSDVVIEIIATINVLEMTCHMGSTC